MKKLFSALSIAAFLGLVSCDNSQQDIEKVPVDTTLSKDSVAFVKLLNDGYFYKHYSGKTLAGEIIEIELTVNNGVAMAYWYQGSNSPQYLDGTIDSAGVLTLRQFDKLSNKNADFFKGILSLKKLSGSISKENTALDLLENYREGSIRFEGFAKNDSVKLSTNPNSPSGNVTVAYLEPNSVDPTIDANKVSLLLLPFYFGEKTKAQDIRSGAAQEVADFYTDYQNTAKGIDVNDLGASFNWESLSETKVVHNDNFLLSLQVSRYQFTGGAHGFSSTELRVLDLKNGVRIKLSDIFQANYKTLLSKIIEQKVRAYFKIADNESLEEGGMLVSNIEPTENFYLTDKGIGFIYNPYEIAAYSYGTVEIYMIYDELEKILNESAITWR